MTVEVVEPNTDIVVHHDASLVPARTESSLITLAGPMADIVKAQQQYQEVCHALLDDNDIQVIGKKQFKTKSAWRKLGVAFGVSTQILSTTHERNERGRIIRTEVVARATAPNGRFAEGIGACDLYERCCDPETCRTPTEWPDGNFRHAHCAVWPCKIQHFSNPQHDIPATAATRATNRAASDLFGMGEVSAEEMTENGAHIDDDRGAAHVAKPPSEKQLSFLNSLISQTGLDLLDITDIIGREVVTPPELSGDECKRAIDHLIKVRDGKADKPASNGSTPTHGQDKATIGQMRAIKVLQGKVELSDDELLSVAQVASMDELTTALASKLIDALNESLNGARA